MNLGAALQALGKRESGSGRLWEAVAAYSAAYEVLMPAWVPLVTLTTIGCLIIGGLGTTAWMIRRRSSGRRNATRRRQHSAVRRSPG